MCNPVETSCLAVVICYSVIFVLPLYSVLILIDVQYLQNVVFTFEMGSNGQNQSSSDSHLWKKKSFLHWDGGGNPPYSLVLFGKPYLWKQLWPQKFAPRCQIDYYEKSRKFHIMFTAEKLTAVEGGREGGLFWPPLISLNSVKISLNKV